MKPTPQTIQIFLPGGDARGIRIAEITTRIVQVIEVPRSLLSDFLKMPESEQVAVYLLVGESAEDQGRSVYIGQTGDLRARLKTHGDRKDFWERALVLVSRTNSLTNTHALFLEWHCLQEVRKAGRFADENGNSGSKPHTPPPLQADCLEIFETGRTLLTTLGYPVFEPIGSAASANENDLFFLTVTGTDGKGLYTSEGFVVFKGSRGKRANVPNFKETHARFRQRLLAEGVMRIDGETVVFQRDHVFGSPSMAAMALLGRTSNGWKEWKSRDGTTLDELKRTGAEDET